MSQRWKSAYPLKDLYFPPERQKPLSVENVQRQWVDGEVNHHVTSFFNIYNFTFKYLHGQLKISLKFGYVLLFNCWGPLQIFTS